MAAWGLILVGPGKRMSGPPEGASAAGDPSWWPMTAGTRGSARIDRPGQAQPCPNMRFSDVAAGAFGQPYQHNHENHNQLDG